MKQNEKSDFKQNQDVDTTNKPGLSKKYEALLKENIAELAMIQSNIQGRNKSCRTIYVTSCFNGEGKSHTAVSMAHGLAINRSRILLVDGNPRKPILHKRYRIQKSPGLLDVLFKGIKTDDAIIATRHQGVDLLPIGEGPAGRPDLTQDDSLHQWLSTQDTTYDFIIMDGLSLIGSSDSPLLASVFDGVAIVVLCEKTKWEVTQEAMKKITMLGGQPLGLVLNKRKFYIPRLFSRRP